MYRFARAFLGVLAAVTLVGDLPALAQGKQSGNNPPTFLDAQGEAYRVKLSRGKARILRLEQDARDVLVADPAIADVVVRTPRLIYILGREVGDTNIFFFDDEGNEILRLDARVEMDLSEVRAALRELLPDEEVKVSAVNSNLFLTGTASSAGAAEDVTRIARRFVGDDESIINMLSIANDQQVVLRVRVAEIQRSTLKELGLRYSFSQAIGQNGLANDAIGFGLFAPQSGFLSNFIPGVGTGLFGASFANNKLFGTNNTFSILVDALERNGLVKTLAEPNLTAISGETASFLAGGEFPIPVAQDENTITVEFREFGIGLDFSPVVVDPNRISMRVNTEVSALSAAGAVTIQGITIPALTTRRASTTVELPSGGSLVIAGLLQDDIRDTIDGIPGLKDIPILGSLFRSVNFQRSETELVIAVTAYLVAPVDEQQIVLPTDGFAPASDIDLYLYGRLHAQYAASQRIPGPGGLKVPTGYIME